MSKVTDIKYQGRVVLYLGCLTQTWALNLPLCIQPEGKKTWLHY